MDAKIYALIGDPIEGTLSPPVMNAAFRSLGLNHGYVAVRVQASQLVDAVAGFRVMNVGGLSVTIPHKISVITLLDGLDQSAVAAGAVNTIKSVRGKLVGFNTDGEGALRHLESKVGRVKGKKVLLVGAGGAARGIGFSLAKAGAELTVANRTAAKARDLASAIECKLRVDVGSMPMGRKPLKSALRKSDILVNATSVGMKPDENRAGCVRCGACSAIMEVSEDLS